MDIPQLYSLLAACGSWAVAICALVVLRVNVRAAKRNTCLQLFIQLAAQYDSADMQNTRGRLARKLLSDPKTLEIADSLIVFYENLAILVRRKLLDKDLVWNTFTLDVRSYWTVLKHYVQHVRLEFSDPTYCEEFEWLSDHFSGLKRSPLGSTPASTTITPEKATKFLLLESLRGNDK
jgi:hypothetical protein